MTIKTKFCSKKNINVIVCVLSSIFILLGASLCEAKVRVEKSYYKNRVLKKIIAYKNGKEIRIRTFNVNGKLMSEYRRLSDTDMHYLERLYYSNGRPKIFIKKDKKKWSYIAYYPNGKVKYDSRHIFLPNGKADVIKKEYNRRGKLVAYRLDEGIALMYKEMPALLKKVDEDYFLSLLEDEKVKLEAHRRHLKYWKNSLDKEAKKLDKKPRQKNPNQ
ncbi:MAG: hypothetical protein NG737_03085 [Omnitrophica bacterium]|nr:hypothetical protein [Candidatus Omnitrophota bacterium]